jgi:hypothetical protein
VDRGDLQRVEDRPDGNKRKAFILAVTFCEPTAWRWAPSTSSRLLDLAFEVAEPIRLPDGKLIHPPHVHGEPMHELACALLDMEDPRESRFIRLTGRRGRKVAAGAVHRLQLWSDRGRPVEIREA